MYDPLDTLTAEPPADYTHVAGEIREGLDRFRALVERTCKYAPEFVRGANLSPSGANSRASVDGDEPYPDAETEDWNALEEKADDLYDEYRLARGRLQ